MLLLEFPASINGTEPLGACAIELSLPEYTYGGGLGIRITVYSG
jgi:hypothetical protein